MIAGAGASDDASKADDDSKADDALCVVLCNAPPERAETIANAVVTARLAACVNIIPGVTSVYFWKGELTRDTEATLIMKTRVSLVDALTIAIRAVHPYEVPEVIALPVMPVLGNAAYHAWVLEETGGKKPASSSGEGEGA